MAMYIVRGHAVATDFTGDDPLVGTLPREHVFVATEKNRSWGCFGRGLADEPNARVVAEGNADDDWIDEINGQRTDVQAGIESQVTGICHQCANRLLIPAGVTVDKANGNEIAILMFGLYGPDISSLVTLISDAAARVNEKRPNAISGEDVQSAISRVTRDSTNEYEILKADFEERIPVDVDALPESQQTQLRQIHRTLYEARVQAYESLPSSDHETRKAQYRAAVKGSLATALHQLQDLFGMEKYREIFKYLPEQATQVVFPPQ